MRTSIRTSLAVAALVALSATPMMARGADTRDELSQEGPWAKGRILVMPRAGVSDADVDRALRVHGGGLARKLGNSGLQIIDLPPGMPEKAMANVLAKNPLFKFAEVDERVAAGFVPNDPYYTSAWHLTKTGAASAWNFAQGAGVIVAILDSGVDATHPDLAGRFVPGWNFFSNNSLTADVHGHGTAVAGAAVAANNNLTGVAAMAPLAKIMPVRITDASAYAYWSTVAQGLTWAADNGARIANISYVGVAASSSVQAAAQYMRSKGGLVFVCAGNNGVNVATAPTSAMTVVSATDANDAKTSWSSFGSFVTISAPGVNIWTTSRGGGYGQWWGTSMASPVVAGIAALMMSAKPTLTNSQIESLLYSTSVDLGATGRDPYFGHGRVNAAAAVQAAYNSTASDTSLPSVAISAPLGGIVKGIVPVNVTASDNVGVVRVELKVNGALVATDTLAPFSYSWDSRTVADGTRSLTAYAYDSAGNIRASSPVTVNVVNAVSVGTDTTAPVVTISNPKAGTTVTGNISVTATATDNGVQSGITQTLSIDGFAVATGNGGSLSHNWNTKKASKGSHTLKVVARDAAGNTASTSVVVYR